MNSAAERSAFLGASDAAPAVGLSRYKQPLSLWLEKTGGAPPEPENDAMLRGRMMEPVVLSLFTRRTGLKVISRQERRFHPELPWMAATLDGETEGGELVEAKTASWRVAHEFGEEETDQIPAEYVCQCAHQLAVTGRGVALVPVLVAGEELRLYRVERNDRLIARLIEMEREFWAMVESRTPPEPDWAHATTPALIAAMYAPTGQQVELPESALVHLLDYQRARDEEAAAHDAKEMAKARIMLAMKDATSARFSDGTVVRRCLVNVKEHVVRASQQTRFTVHKPKGR